MAAKRWDFRDEDLRRYSVELEHSVLSGDRRIVVNGREVFRGGKFFDTGSEHPFDIEGHSARLRIGSNGFGYTYHLVVDGLAIPPEGATIPRPPRTAPVDVAPATAPDLAAAAQPMIAALAQAPDRTALTRAGLVQRVENGGRWFYWIAALSAINFALFALGSEAGFALGTAIDWFIDGILQELAPAVSWVSHVVTIAFFVFLGMRATAGATWAFIVGGLVYALDAVIFLLVGDWIGIIIHAVALFAIVNALLAVRQLGHVSLRPTPAT
ncbi:MAG: hypothetical protein ACRDF9_08410 [Candidatus Limnocylindria bacterium]